MESAKVEKYNAVRCHSCGLPIAVSDASLQRARTGEALDSSVPQYPRSSILNVRCYACEREDLYGPADVVELEGTPWTPWTPTGPSVSSRFLHSRFKVARAAGA